MTTLTTSTTAVSRSSPGTTPSTRAAAGKALLWAIQLAVAGMFFMAGVLKLSGAPEMVGLFDALGTGQWFRYVTGGIEVMSAMLVLIPATAFLGGVLLAATMVGALLTHVLVIGGSIAASGSLLVGSLVIAWARRPAWIDDWRARGSRLPSRRV